MFSYLPLVDMLLESEDFTFLKFQNDRFENN